MSVAAETRSDKFNTGKVVLMASAHAMHDTYSGFLPALLPLLIQKFALTNTTAGLLSLFYNLPSLLQPLIGRLADRRNLRLLIILSPAITGVAMSCLGIAPSTGFLIFLLVISGLSSASLHATGPVVSSVNSGSKLGRGMSLWMMGGELGRSLGPLLVVTAVGYIGLKGLPWLALAGILVSIFLGVKLASLSTRSEKVKDDDRVKVKFREVSRIFLPLAVLIIARSLMAALFTTFLPTYLTSEGSTLWVAGASLSIMQIASVPGTLITGTLSDRLGRKRMLVISYVLTPILTFLFIQIKGFWQIPLLILIGIVGISIIPVFMAIILESFPGNRSFANGIYMAFNFILQSVAILAAGKMADVFGMRLTFLIAAGLFPLGVPFIFLLPKSAQKQ